MLGALIIRKDLTREAMVGTLGFFGFVGNLFKIAGFTLVGFSFAEFWPLILCMVVATILGARLGRHLLPNVNETTFRAAFRVMLVALAFKLIFVDGFGLLTDSY